MLSDQSLAEVLKAKQFQAGAWSKVIACARQYAMMKATGRYVENGVVRWISKGEQQDYTEMFGRNLCQAAEAAFIEDAMMGAAVQSTPDPQ